MTSSITVNDPRLDEDPFVRTALDPSARDLITELGDVAAMFSAEQARIDRDSEHTVDPLLVELGRRQLAILAELRARELRLRRAIAIHASKSAASKY